MLAAFLDAYLALPLALLRSRGSLARKVRATGALVEAEMHQLVPGASARTGATSGQLP